MRRLYAITGLGAAALVAGVTLAHLPRILDRREAETPAPAAVALAITPAATAPAVPAPTIAPAVDVVRISPAGDAVIAGRVAPGAKVVVRDGGTMIGEVKADSRGEWVLVPDTGLPVGEHRLTLEGWPPEGEVVRGTETIVVVVIDRSGDTVGGRSPSGAPPSLAAAVPDGGAGPPRLLQSDGSGDLPVAIDAVHHDDAGHLVVIGRAPPQSSIRLYLDDVALGGTVSAADGRWRLSAERRLGAGEHRVRADRVEAEGRVDARGEVLFRRQEVVGGSDKPATLVVRRGDHLWAIARTIFGHGSAYTLIYDANRDQIRNPDLIYPGQVFSVPAGR